MVKYELQYNTIGVKKACDCFVWYDHTFVSKKGFLLNTWCIKRFLSDEKFSLSHHWWNKDFYMVAYYELGTLLGP